MADLRARVVEREQSPGDVEGRARHLKTRTRAGDLDPCAVDLAAFLGDEAARRMLGVPDGWWISSDTALGCCWGPPDDGDDRDPEEWTSVIFVLSGDLIRFLQRIPAEVDCQERYKDPLRHTWPEVKDMESLRCPECDGRGRLMGTAEGEGALRASLAVSHKALVLWEARRGWVAKRVKRRKQRGHVIKLVPHNKGLINRVMGDDDEEDWAPRRTLALAESLLTAEDGERKGIQDALRDAVPARWNPQDQFWCEPAMLAQWLDHSDLRLEAALTSATGWLPDVTQVKPLIRDALVPWLLKEKA